MLLSVVRSRRREIVHGDYIARSHDVPRLTPIKID